MLPEQRRTGALYIRVSSEEQVEGFSLEAQRNELTRYCTSAHMDIYDVYVDAGLSGKSIDGRPALRKLLHDADKGRFQVVLCLRLNRLSRKLVDLLHIIERLDRNGISFHSLTENFQTDTPAGKFYLQMAGSVAEYEREQIIQNTRHGMQKRNRLGGWNSGNQVLGYRWIVNPLNSKQSFAEIVPEEAEVVQAMFEWYASGLGLKAIANRLNGAGVQTKRGKMFCSVSVRGILSNVNYIGIITYSDEANTRVLVKGSQPPIVPQSLWDRVQERLQQRSRPVAKAVSRSFPLAGLLKCPACGSGMVPGHVRRRRRDGTSALSFYYVCGRYNSGGGFACRPHNIRADAAEDWVEERLRDVLLRPHVAEQLIAEINRKREQRLLPSRQRLKEIDNRLAFLKKSRLHCYEMFEDGQLDSAEFKARMDSVREEAVLLEDERRQTARTVEKQSDPHHSETSIRDALERFRPLLRSASGPQKKRLFQSLIDRIAIPANRNIAEATIYGTAALHGLELQFKSAKESQQA
ncbi:recombinase family protein [Cohnella fermenti]|uniref:Recombinase family protein n=1 Tax=Cohnella fermenti TaxID=2565925 RepID=A0A4S4BJ84_9BACL|nr:recombinase family protein [Cohnella fermenti]THF74126.1 recombinase family protein [Cohnella fermenti]